MSFNIIATSSFIKELKKLGGKYPSLKHDYSRLLDDIESNPKLGTSIGRNCYKIRLAIGSKNKGKSSGARVITHLILTVNESRIYLLKIYDKSSQDNITEAELSKLLSDIAS